MWKHVITHNCKLYSTGLAACPLEEYLPIDYYFINRVLDRYVHIVKPKNLYPLF